MSLAAEDYVAAGSLQQHDKGWIGPLQHFWEQIITARTKGRGVQEYGGQEHRGFLFLKIVLSSLQSPWLGAHVGCDSA